MKVLSLLTFAAVLGASASASLAQTGPSLTTLYGAGSYVNVVMGPNGALYGTGKSNTVFALAPPASPGGAWTETVLHTFTGQNGDGSAPYGCPLRGKSGALYGTTQEGGTLGLGIVYELTPPATQGGAWTENVIYTFTGGTDGSYPFTSLVMGKSGALYGTTSVGGDAGSPIGCNGLGCGTVYELTPPSTPGGTWTETVPYRFTGGNDGGNPAAGLTIGPNGVLYGTTEYGGASADGVAFALTPPSSPGGVWTQTVLHTFTGQNGDGAFPWSGLTIGPHGVLYGTTTAGGTANMGTVYALTPPATTGGEWTETVLHTFTGASDGSDPLGGVLIGSSGKLFGTTLNFGGSKSCPGYDCGTVFMLQPPAAAGGAWTETILHSFGGGQEGAGPWAGLVMGKSGALYGTTAVDGTSNTGTVFELTP